MKKDIFFIQKSSWTSIVGKGYVQLFVMSIFCGWGGYWLFSEAEREIECFSISSKGNFFEERYGFDESALFDDEKGIVPLLFKRVLNSKDSLVIGLNHSDFYKCSPLLNYAFEIDIEEEGGGYSGSIRSVGKRNILFAKFDKVSAKGKSRCSTLFRLSHNFYKALGYERWIIDKYSLDGDLSCKQVSDIAEAVYELKNGSPYNAQEMFKKLYVEDSRDVISLMYYMYVTIGLLNKAVDDVKLPDNVPDYLYYLLAENEFLKGDYNKAVSFYEKSLGMDYPWGENKLFYLYFQMGDIERSKFFHKKAKEKIGIFESYNDRGYMEGFQLIRLLDRENRNFSIMEKMLYLEKRGSEVKELICMDVKKQYERYNFKRDNGNGFFVFNLVDFC